MPPSMLLKNSCKNIPECLLYGQDVGRRLGGVFREAAALAEKFGDHRVFNTAIQEAYIIGFTAGLSAVGFKARCRSSICRLYLSRLNQLVTEISKSAYLSKWQFSVSMVLRVPIMPMAEAAHTTAAALNQRCLPSKA